MKKAVKTMHKYLGIPASIVMLYMSCSGILLNHPKMIAGVDAPVFLLPPDMRFSNWGRGAAQCFAGIGDSVLIVGGKVGVFISDARGNHFERRRKGLPGSVAKGEITDLLTRNDTLYAGTPSGLFMSIDTARSWHPTGLTDQIVSTISLKKRIVAFSEKNAYVKTINNWQKVPIAEKQKSRHSRSLVRFIFAIHSGEILGFPGRLLIDVAGLALFILGVSGLILTFLPMLRGKIKAMVARFTEPLTRYHLLHYRRLGWVLLIPMLILPITGFFMRPPFVMLLAPSAESTQQKPAETGMQEIAAVTFDTANVRLIIADKQRLYTIDTSFLTNPVAISRKLPVHPMGITGIAMENRNTVLVGSFAGLVRYNLRDSSVSSFPDGKPVGPASFRRQKPLWQVRALSSIKHSCVVVDFRKGPQFLNKQPALRKMPDNAASLSPSSLWHFLFEVHNGRALRSFFRKWYVLHNPFVAILTILALSSGIPLIIKRTKKKMRAADGLPKG